MAVFCGTIVLHGFGDMFLHVDDGHPHFWPLTRCIIASPISYWDPAHYGLWWTGLEMLLAVGLAALIWQRSPSWWARSYAGGLVVLYWLLSLMFFAWVFNGGDRDDRPESFALDRPVLPTCFGSADVATPDAQT